MADRTYRWLLVSLAVIGLSADQVERVYRDIDQKRRTTRYLHSKPLLVQPVSEVSA